ncbi:superoxide dismutase family protein [Aurantibacter sp.]|uniref:superoxide dismutase family protein n=1 Tax=Aurantibacter sp. TaxID=2807103 RepID=UPI00326717B1
MKYITIITLALVLIGSYGCKEAKNKTESTTDGPMEVISGTKNTESLTILMEPKSESEVRGEVTFTEDDNTVKMLAVFTGLSEGEHAIHLHEKADCSSDDGKSSGGHWNPTREPHGKWNDEGGYHKGDIGNFTADANGDATVEFSAGDEWCIGCEDERKNILNKAVIVHQGKDDFMSQPSGDAGARVSCSGIIK